MSYTYLTINDCIRIENFPFFGFSGCSIAKTLNHYHSTIACEFFRNKSQGFYYAEIVQSFYCERHVSCFPIGKFSANIVKSFSVKLLKNGLLSKLLMLFLIKLSLLKQSIIENIKAKYLMFQQKIYVIKINAKRRK